MTLRLRAPQERRPAGTAAARFFTLPRLWLLGVLLLVQGLASQALAQNITLKATGQPLAKVLKQLGRQAGKEVFYTQEQLQNARPVTVDIRNQPLQVALESVFKDQPFTYALANNTIVIKPRPAAPPKDGLGAGVLLPVRGQVLDERGEPFIGVTVNVVGTNLYTTTDAEGRFALARVPADATIVCTGLAIQPVYVGVAGRSELPVLATERQNALDEVVVSKGYYSEEQKATTGNVVTINARDIVKTPTTDPIQALQGRVAGLAIQSSSGLPGTRQEVNLRGTNSLSNGTAPLYLINGVPYSSTTLSSSSIGGTFTALPGGLSPLAALNPADIERITILKDADATAIYGSRGANGVVLITTKKATAGKARLTLDFSSAVQAYPHTTPLLNTEQYLALRREAFRNDGQTPGTSNYDVNGTYDQTRYTNWQRELLGKTARIQNLQASFGGGNEHTQFLMSGGYRRQTLPFRYADGLGDQLLSLRSNVNHTSDNGKLNVNLDLNYVHDRNIVPQQDPTNAALTLPPNAPALLDSAGNINWANNTFNNNPLGALQATTTSRTQNLIGNLAVRYTILAGLDVSANAGYTQTQLDELSIVPGTSFSPTVLAQGYVQRSTSVGYGRTRSWIAEPKLSYERTLGQGRVSALVGTTFQQTENENSGFQATGFPNDAQLLNYSIATTKTFFTQQYGDYHYTAVYGRLNYNWQSKYIVNLTGRRDGSSRFGPGRQFGSFGAVGAAWVFSEEAWAKPKWLSLGKLRASYGVTGNDQISNYTYLSTYSYSQFPYGGTAALVPTSLANDAVAWEVNRKLEGGLELGFLEGRLNVSASYFRNRSGNQLVSAPLPAITGFTAVTANLPAVVQNEGLELTLNTTNLRTRTFTWRTAFNYSRVRNTLVEFPDLARSGYENVYTVGQSIGTPRLYHYTGVNPLTGAYSFEDVNRDGQLSIADYVPAKTLLPQYFGGLNNSFTYKGLQLDVFVQFVKQNGRSFLSAFGTPGFYGNRPTAVLDRWQQPGDVAPVQKVTAASFGSVAGQAYSNFTQSDYTIVDASYLRLKNVSLSYTVPAAWRATAHLADLQLYVTANNLLTLTPYEGADPESGGSRLPPLRTVLLGVRVGL